MRTTVPHLAKQSLRNTQHSNLVGIHQANLAPLGGVQLHVPHVRVLASSAEQFFMRALLVDFPIF